MTTLPWDVLLERCTGATEAVIVAPYIKVRGFDYGDGSTRYGGIRRVLHPLDSAGHTDGGVRLWTAEQRSLIEEGLSGFTTGCMPNTIALMIGYWSVQRI